MHSEQPSVPPPGTSAPAIPSSGPEAWEAPSPATVGQLLANMSVGTGIALLGVLIVVAGSLGPWVDTVFGSVSGIRGDGRITLGAGLVAAVFTLLGSSRRGGSVSVALTVLCAAVAGVVAVIDIAEVSSRVADAELFGKQVANTGWGLYAVAVGAAVIIVGAVASARHRYAAARGRRH
jgi:hypothetical protein